MCKEFPPLDPVSHPNEADCHAVWVFRRMVKEALRLPTNSEVFLTTEKFRVVIPDDVSLVELFSGVYGTVSVAKPLLILVTGNWTIGADGRSPNFREWLQGITKTGQLPPLPPVDMVGRFTEYPTYASTLEIGLRRWRDLWRPIITKPLTWL
jgi:hypothetical protein